MLLLKKMYIINVIFVKIASTDTTLLLSTLIGVLRAHSPPNQMQQQASSQQAPGQTKNEISKLANSDGYCILN
ncbi:MAG: phage terminase large subunit GpA-like protein [Bacillariaceae sp.]|jgi:hypothetical protein